MVEIALLFTFAVLVGLVCRGVSLLGERQINSLAADAPADPHADCPYGKHHVVICGTCNQPVDLHNGYEVAHHQVPGHSPETIQ